MISAAKVVKELGGIPLALEQARSVVRDGIPMDDLIDIHDSVLMAQKPPRSAWDYEKNVSLVVMFGLVVSRLATDDNALELLSLFACFGPRIVAMNLLSEFWKSNSELRDEPPADSSPLGGKLKKLILIGQDKFTFPLAVGRLERLCLIKTRKDDQAGLSSAAMHSAVCKWRLNTIA